jgi:hypothetical protein
VLVLVLVLVLVGGRRSPSALPACLQQHAFQRQRGVGFVAHLLPWLTCCKPPPASLRALSQLH